jgi:predicted solute-binding protein
MKESKEIYHRFVQYEWNETSDSMKKSIIDAIEYALERGYEKGYIDATKEACEEISKNYKPNDFNP